MGNHYTEREVYLTEGGLLAGVSVRLSTKATLYQVGTGGSLTFKKRGQQDAPSGFQCQVIESDPSIDGHDGNLVFIICENGCEIS